MRTSKFNSRLFKVCYRYDLTEKSMLNCSSMSLSFGKKEVRINALITFIVYFTLFMIYGFREVNQIEIQKKQELCPVLIAVIQDLSSMYIYFSQLIVGRFLNCIQCIILIILKFYFCVCVFKLLTMQTKS